MTPRWTAENSSKSLRPKRMAAIVGTVIALLASGVEVTHADELVRPAVSNLTIRPRVTVPGRVATVQDVLSLRDADPRVATEIGTMTIVENGSTAGTTLSVSHKQIVDRLEQLGVNPARVTVGGALECKVTFQGAANAPGAPQSAVTPRTGSANSTPGAAAAPAPDSQSILRDAPPSEGATLATAIRETIRREFGNRVANVEVEFERAGQEYLELTTPPFSFDIRSGADRERLGIREISVTIRRDGRTVRTVRLGANVRASRRIVVATRPLNVGTTLKREDLRLEERLFDGGQDLGHDQIELLIGQQIVRFVSVDTMLQTKDIKSVDLVTRSSPVTVTRDGGAIQLRASGIAMDAGGYGEIVRVRLGDNRKDQRVIRAVVTAPGTVRVIEDNAGPVPVNRPANRSVVATPR